MLGAWDSRPSSGRIILVGYRHRFMFCQPGGKNFVATGDVAKGIVSALSHGKDGESYLLSGENMTYREFGISYRPVSEAIDEAASWFYKCGMLKKRLF